MRRADTKARPMARAGRGFTLTELLVVIVIIGLIVGFVVSVALDGVRRGQERATQALVTKLETAVADRLEALLGQTPEVNAAHRFLASIAFDTPGGPVFIESEARAFAIARVDLIRAEMPDVFFVQINPNAPIAADAYPFNFGAVHYPATIQNPTIDNFKLPLGNSVGGVFGAGVGGPGTGIYGASYGVAGGLYKLLGYHPNGYDGVDNDGDGLIDEWDEGTGPLPAAQVAEIVERLQRHVEYDGQVANNKKTARAEMLYALLVEGRGPLGSVFTADDFNDLEVGDTDGDGLPEFLDAWGNPIQFFRWPTHYTGDPAASGNSAQKGYLLYTGNEPRQQSPLDPNLTLVAPAWWSALINNAAPEPFTAVAGMSGQAAEFQRQFFSLRDPWFDALPAASRPGQVWDRSGTFARRSFFSRPLILSAGPDGNPGVGQLQVDYGLVNDLTITAGAPAVGYSAANLIQVESQAAPLVPIAASAAFASGFGAPTNRDTSPVSGFIIESGYDDITNFNIQAAGGGSR